MSVQHKNVTAVEAPSEKEVFTFLKRNPRYFMDNPQLLEEIQLRHTLNGATSLIERQVDVMREQNRYLKKQLQDLVKIARNNGELNERVQRLALSLIGAKSFSETCDTLVKVLREQFHLDGVALRLYGDEEFNGDKAVKLVDPESHELDIFGRVMGERRPICGYVPPSQLEYLFGSRAATIRSTALLPLRGERSIGLLALGSHDGQRFSPDAATDFLEKIAELASKALNQYL